MRACLPCLVASALLCGVAAAAHASTMDVFTYSLSGVSGTGTATLAATPTPASYVNGTSFTIDNLATSFDGNSFSGSVTFLAAGGVEGDGITFSGPELFTGSVSAPTFRLGTFLLGGDPDLGNGPVPVTASLTISQPSTAVTPEPGTLLLAGTGALALAGAMRRRLA